MLFQFNSVQFILFSNDLLKNTIKPNAKKKKKKRNRWRRKKRNRWRRYNKKQKPVKVAPLYKTN